MIMKLKRVFVIVLSSILLNLACGKKKDSVVPYAINAIIEQHFVNLETYPGIVNIKFYGQYNFKFSELINNLLKIKSANTKVEVSITEVIGSSGYAKYLEESDEDYIKTNKNLLLQC